MTRFYEPDLGANPDSPFARDASGKLIRRSYWLDMTDRTLVKVMVNGIGAHLTNDEKRAHLIDLKRDHLIDQVCVQEILPPENKFVSFRTDRDDHGARLVGEYLSGQKSEITRPAPHSLIILSSVGGSQIDSRRHPAPDAVDGGSGDD